LKRKGVAATVNQILPGKGVPEHVQGRLLHASPSVILGDCTAKAIFCERFAAIIGEEIIIRAAFSDTHVLAQDNDHGLTERRKLGAFVLCVLEDDKTIFQIHILVLDETDGTGAVTAIDEIVDDYPVSVLGKAAALHVWLFKQQSQFSIGIGFLDDILAFVKLDVYVRQIFGIAPTQETFKRPGIAVDGRIL